MMFNFSENDIISYFNKIKSLANKQYKQANYEAAVKYIECASMIAYQTNFIYNDQELESLIKKIAGKLIHAQIFSAVKRRIVFYDSSGVDNVALTQQYIKAFISWDCEFLYIVNNSVFNKNKAQNILHTLNKYDKAEVCIVNNDLSRTEKIRFIYKKIADFAPEKAFLHLTSFDIIPLIVYAALYDIERYQINLTDDAFWLGTHCADYFIEFRNYGCNVSLQKRFITSEQLLLQPYYPIIHCKEFKGLPSLQDHVKIFTGGALYKMLGDQNLFFDLLKLLLGNYSNVAILIAGSGNQGPFLRFIRDHHYEDRVFLLGQRDDIVHVFEHVDIYLSSYPIAGGLMAQLAAVNAIPILAFTKKNIPGNFVESLLTCGSDVNLTKTDLSDFKYYADKLIKDENFRKAEGLKLKDCIIQPHEFNKHLYEIVFENKTSVSNLKKIDIDYEYWSKIYLEVENRFLHNCVYELVSTFKFSMIYLFPKATCVLLKVMTKKETIIRILQRIKKGYGLLRRN